MPDMFALDASHSFPPRKGTTPADEPFRAPQSESSLHVHVIGGGYVGLVSGACLASERTRITIVERDAAKLDSLRRGIIPIYEPGLDDIVRTAVLSGWLQFTSSLENIGQADAVMIAVGTPSDPKTGAADLSFLQGAIDGLLPFLRDGQSIIIKSTVPVGTNVAMRRRIAAARPDLDIDVVSNPEFLREGQAIRDFLYPDRIVVGVASERAVQLMSRLYENFLPEDLSPSRLFVTRPESAELIKYAANAFLAMKITFINEMADIAERTGADIDDIARGIGLDPRIGPDFLKAGPGYGGSCFPKDTLALLEIGRNCGATPRLVETTIAVNDARKRDMAGRILSMLPTGMARCRIGVLGVAFKPGTDDMRDSPALDILPDLLAAGHEIRAYDPAAAGNAGQMIPGITWCASPLEAAIGADVLVMLTDWAECSAFSLEAAARVMRHHNLVDLRNAWDREEADLAGFRLLALGRAPQAH